MKHKKWIAILLLLLMCWPAAAWAVVEAPPEGYVADYANVLTDETEAYLIERVDSWMKPLERRSWS